MPVMVSFADDRLTITSRPRLVSSRRFCTRILLAQGYARLTDFGVAKALAIGERDLSAAIPSHL
jgi:hypothetical protein